jgi:hypothetical protein
LSVSVCPHIPIPFSNPHFPNPAFVFVKKYKNRSKNRVFLSVFIRFHLYRQVNKADRRGQPPFSWFPLSGSVSAHPLFLLQSCMPIADAFQDSVDNSLRPLQGRVYIPNSESELVQCVLNAHCTKSFVFGKNYLNFD